MPHWRHGDINVEHAPMVHEALQHGLAFLTCLVFVLLVPPQVCMLSCPFVPLSLSYITPTFCMTSTIQLSGEPSQVTGGVLQVLLRCFSNAIGDPKTRSENSNGEAHQLTASHVSLLRHITCQSYFPFKGLQQGRWRWYLLRCTLRPIK